MQKRKIAFLPYLFVIAIVLFNTILFYFFQCDTEYFESKDYRGNVQSVARKTLLSERAIRNQLPEDEVEALEILQKIIYSYQMPKYRKEEEKLEEIYPFLENFSAEEYIFVEHEIKESLRYKDTLKSMEDHARALADIELFQHKGFQEDLALTVKDFYGMSNIEFAMVPDYGFNVWMNYRIADFLLVLLAVSLAFFCARAYKKELEQSLQAGKRVLWRGVFLILLGGIGLYVLNFMLVSKFIMSYDWSMLLQNLPVFHYCTRTIPLWVFMVLLISVKISFGIFLYGALLGILHRKGKKQIWYASVFSGVVVLEGVLSFVPLQGSVIDGLKEINLFSCLTFERFFVSYWNLNLFGSVVPRLSLFLIVYGIGFLAVFVLARYAIKVYSNETLERVQYSYYQDINQKYMETRQLWHDFHNHLLTIQDLMRKGEIDAANRYMNDLEGVIDDTHILTKTGMDALDVLLYHKSEQATKKGITLEFCVGAKLLEEEFLPVDLCCVVGNLLDNSIEALEKCKNVEKRASMEITKKGDMLYLHMENPYEGDLLEEGQVFKTTKEDVKNHGLGLRGVERVCRRYNGSLELQTTEGKFCVQALLMARKSE